MASSYAEATARPAFAEATARQAGRRDKLGEGNQRSVVRCRRSVGENADCGLRIAIMPEVEIRFSVVADQAAEEED